jgi:hypothetical protein
MLERKGFLALIRRKESSVWNELSSEDWNQDLQTCDFNFISVYSN